MDEFRGMTGFKFSDNGKGIWLEGTCQVAAVYNLLGTRGEAIGILNQIPEISRGGGVEAAYPTDAFTGFHRDFGTGKGERWMYLRRESLASTCWFLFAYYQVNPFWLGGSNRANDETK